jgi:hypothetical protein
VQLPKGWIFDGGELRVPFAASGGDWFRDCRPGSFHARVRQYFQHIEANHHQGKGRASARNFMTTLRNSSYHLEGKEQEEDGGDDEDDDEDDDEEEEDEEDDDDEEEEGDAEEGEGEGERGGGRKKVPRRGHTRFPGLLRGSAWPVELSNGFRFGRS